MSTAEMSRQHLIHSESHEISNSYNDEITSHHHHHYNERPTAEDALSQTSFYSVIDLDHDTLIERAAQLASMLEKSARDLKTYTKLARTNNGHSVTRTKKPKLPRAFTNNLLPITALWQALCLLALTFVDVYCRKIEKDKNHTLSYNVSIGIISVFQLVDLCVVFAATVKLTKQYLHKTASMRFLINGYFSMIVLFAGLYMLIYRYSNESFEVASSESKRFQYSIEIFIHMLNVSISTATLCGAASITGQTWYAALAMSVQMLISFIYFASFLSQVLSPPQPATGHDNKHSKLSKSVYGSV